MRHVRDPSYCRALDKRTAQVLILSAIKVSFGLSKSFHRFPLQRIRAALFHHAAQERRLEVCAPRGLRMVLDQGLRFESSTRVATTSAIPPSAWPTMKITPYIVEYQWGSSDMTQSIEAKVTVRA